MSEMLITAPPLSWASIESKAWSIRETFGLHEKLFFPVMAFLESVLSDKLEFVSLDVWPDAKCEGAEGYTCQKGEYIILPESVYRQAWDNMPRARFTVAHELGHLFLHAGRPLPRIQTTQRVAPFRDPEKQADRFAASLLMPWPHFRGIESRHEVVDLFGVSNQAAEIRYDEWQKKKGRPK